MVVPYANYGLGNSLVVSKCIFDVGMSSASPHHNRPQSLHMHSTNFCLKVRYRMPHLLFKFILRNYRDY